MKKILFVCSGNTCRSPLAEGIARKILPGKTKVPTEVSSAGTSAVDGMPASQHAVAVASQRGIDLLSHRSRLLTRSMVRDADLIVTMGRKHRDTVGIIDPDATNYTVLLTDFGEGTDEVPDPIGGDEEEYERIYRLIERCVGEMAAKLDEFGRWKTASGTDGEAKRESQ